MINIGIICFNSGNYGGIEHQIINIVSRVDSNKYHFILITNQETQFSSVFKKHGDIYYVNPKNIWKASKKVKKIVEDESISIIQSHMLREHYIGALTKLRKKSLYHIFRVHTYINCSWISELKKNLYHILSFILSSKIDLYLPINEKNAEELIKVSKINSRKVRVLHDGVKKIENERTSQSFNYHDLAMIANFDYGKGHNIAVRALQVLIKDNPNYKLTLIGYERNKQSDGNSIMQQTKELARELGVENNIKFLGFVENVGEVIKNIDIIILPSYSEGTPNCLLEAMSAKKIVIASAVGGIPEFITDGNNGFLHENKDYIMLAKKIKKLKELKIDELNKICENGYETWKKEYSVENLCMYLETLYKEKGEEV